VLQNGASFSKFCIMGFKVFFSIGKNLKTSFFKIFLFGGQLFFTAIFTTVSYFHLNKIIESGT